MAQITRLSKADAGRILALGRERKERDRQGAFILEGEKLIAECLDRPHIAVRAIVVSQAYMQKGRQDLLTRLVEHPCPVHLCPDPLFERLSDVRTSAGLLAVLEKPRWQLEAVLARRKLLGVYGEHLQDPTNVGTIIRTAAAFSVDALWLSPDSADAFNPKVVRASAGAILTLPVFSLPTLAPLLHAGCTVLAAEGRNSGQELRTVQSLPTRVILALGNESQGLSETVLAQAAIRFHIAIDPTVESLNVATAAGICLFHLTAMQERSMSGEVRGELSQRALTARRPREQRP